MASVRDSLASYRAKRNFRITAEPGGDGATPLKKTRAGKTGAADKAQIFVIQRHHASHLHYDFRLELDGTLKSWAVPKGPSLDPKDKRLAVHVEDHPISYAEFEGTIPEKQYGAGEVVLWDRGTWQADGNAAAAYKAGKIKFELAGEKLHGHWTLVRTHMGKNGAAGKENWLLIKERDSDARPAGEYDITTERPESVKALPARRKAVASSRLAAVANVAAKSTSLDANEAAKKSTGQHALRTTPRTTQLPGKIEPQLATLVTTAPADDGWTYELKLDGYRILTRIDDAGKVRAFTRNGLDWSAKIPALIKAIGALGLRNTWLDGEIVVLNADGKPGFQLLQNAFADHATQSIQYFLFDIPFFDGQDLRAEPWTARREVLDAAMKKNRSALLGVTDALPSPIADIWSNVCHHGLEGLIGKRTDAPYSSGRSSSWIKVKCSKRQEFVICGYTNPKGSRTGFGALLLGVNEDGKLRYAGRVGTGFDESRLTEMFKELKSRAIDDSPFAKPPTGADVRDVHWVKPELVGEVAFAEWTKEGVVRQAVFHGLRADKPASAITVEKAAHAPGNGKGKGKTKSASVAVAPAIAKGKGAGKGRVTTESGVIVSHPDRIVDPSSGLTKLDLVLYYEKISDYMLPHLNGRPIAMLRVPENINGEQFFQKHLDKYVIPGALKIPGLDPGHGPVVVLNNQKALAGAAQMNTVELHTWNALARSIEKPDRIIFDLDPDPSLSWEKVIDATKLTRTLLEELGLKVFLKTSGGRGLHIVVPMLRKHEWAAAKDFAQAVSQHLARAIPDRFSAKMGAQNRIGKVFVDYLRNGRGATTVAAFSARARPGLAVSVPVSWGELEKLRASDQWNIVNVHDYLAARKTDPWAGYEKSRQSLATAIKTLKSA
ncbi:MAG: DNA ligase D [Betaproteobacteria bacterium]